MSEMPPQTYTLSKRSVNALVGNVHYVMAKFRRGGFVPGVDMAMLEVFASDLEKEIAYGQDSDHGQ